MVYNAELSGIRRFLWLLRLVCWLSGGTLRTWKARRRKESP